MLSKQYISFNKFKKNKCFNLNFSKIKFFFNAYNIFLDIYKKYFSHDKCSNYLPFIQFKWKKIT